MLKTDINHATGSGSELSDEWHDADGELYDDGFTLSESDRQMFEQGGYLGSFQSDIHLRGPAGRYLYQKIWTSPSEFEEWLHRECQSKAIEFNIKDTRRPKGVRSVQTTRIIRVCSRSGRSGGTRYYMRKHPDRVQKIPSKVVSVSILY
jgi:hypothetical protein